MEITLVKNKVHREDVQLSGNMHKALGLIPSTEEGREGGREMKCSRCTQ